MKIKFNGVMERKSGGCAACGKRAKSAFGLSTTKAYYLPSGKHLTFRVGEVYDLSETDARFLLSYNDAPDPNGLTRKVFEWIM